MDLSIETQAFQVYCESVRAYPGDMELQQDFERARRAMEIAWLERMAAGPGKPASGAEDGHGRNAGSRPFDPEVGVTTDGVW